jgi:hypothetical protein
MDLSERVVSKVAVREGVSEEELPPLYDSIEPDALEELFHHTNTRTATDLLVQFSYVGYTVTIRKPGAISIER